MSTDSSGTKHSREITFDELRQLKLAPGDIVWKKKNGKLTTLCNSGDQIDHEYISKFEKITQSLWLETQYPESIKKDALDIFLRLKTEDFDRERFILRKEFIELTGPYLWNEKKELCLFELVLIFNESFSCLTNKHITSLESIGLDLYKRSSYEASMNVLIAFIIGYLDYNFLSELYHVSFYQHYEFTKGRPNSSNLEFIDFERTNFGQLPDELTSHAHNSYEFFIKEKPYEIKNKSITKLISRHQERLTGVGYPSGLNKDELSDLDRIIIWSNTKIDEVMVQDSGYRQKGILKKLMMSRFDEVLEGRLQRLVEYAFEKEFKKGAAA